MPIDAIVCAVDAVAPATVARLAPASTIENRDADRATGSRATRRCCARDDRPPRAVRDRRSTSFVSLLEPPDDAASRGGPAACSTAVGRCSSARRRGATWCSASPVILYDYPAVAPESRRRLLRRHRDRRDAHAAGPDAHRRGEGRGAGAPTPVPGRDHRPLRHDVDAETASLHGVVHGAVRSPIDARRPDRSEPGVERPRAAAVRSSAAPWVAAGDKVRLRPVRRADAHDLFLRGRVATSPRSSTTSTATSTSRSRSTTIPAADLLDWQGRYLYFAPDEVEALVATEPP